MLPTPPDRIKTLFGANLDGDYWIMACGPNAPKEDVIAAFERKIGFPLPSDFRSFSMSQYGGIYIEVKDTIWPRAKLGDIGPFWGFLRGLMVYGFSTDI